MKNTTTTIKDVVLENDIPTYLSLIDNIFGLEKILSSANNKRDTVKYYRASHIAYKFLHSRQGAVHMALSTEGKFSKEDYVKQPAFVEEIIKEDCKKNVLEFGSGNGYNSIYLAKRNPHVTFTSIDLTPIHIKESKKHSREIDNVHFYEADFEDTHLKSNSYDLLFSIESVCHAYQLEKALSEAFRLLKKNGKLVIYDGFRKINPDTLSKDLQTMTLLVERSMSVGNGNTTEHFVEILRKIGFQEIVVEDFSHSLMPNLLQLQNYALHYFNKIPRAKFLKKILPFDLLKNAIAGLFMPLTVELGIHGYYRIIAKK